PPDIDAELDCAVGFAADGVWWLSGSHAGREAGLHRHAGDGWELVQDGRFTLVGAHWAAREGTLYRLGETVRPELTSADLGGTGDIRLLREDGAAVWVQTTDGLVARVAADGSHSVAGRPPVAARARDVLAVDGAVWVGTYGGGLHLLGPEPRSLDRHNGLCDDAISRMFVVDGYVWLNTNRGAGRVSLQALRDVQAGRASEVLCELVDSGEANGASGVMYAGSLYLPTIHGAVRIDPRRALGEAVEPRVHLRNAHCGATPLAEGAEVRGPCDLAVDLVGIAFDDPVGVRFRHRVVGLHDAWSELSEGRRLEIARLDPGDYRLEVQAQSSRGAWSSVTALDFRRAPLWWESRAIRLGGPSAIVLFAVLLLSLRILTTSRQNRELREEVERRVRAEEDLKVEVVQRQRVSAELAEVRRLEVIGRMAAGVGHDFNNLLMVVFAAMDRLRTVPGTRTEVELVSAAAEQASGLTRQLLSLGSRRNTPPHLEIDATAVILKLRPVLAELGSPADVTVEADPDVLVRVAPSRLEQVVTNLVLNATNAGAKHIAVTLRATEEHALLQVVDDGAGMPDEVQDRAFEPYFSRRSSGRGSGLGLAIVRSVVDDAAGTVNVSSEEGVGSTFTVRFPRVRA
ncbi:MAG: HAMP domain-containing histidine kinase, partial [Alphaproteobacteria bacterium]|nr:HAMP domain-containing histidine kinase [Alphaproteobacteria bacterium]